MAHADLEVLKRRLDEAQDYLNIPGVYRHYKGAQYLLRDVIITEATDEPEVVYSPLEEPSVRFGRPFLDFLQVVQHEGTWVNRYQFIGRPDDLPKPGSA